MATRTTPVHAHGCAQCKARFEDTCSEPNSPGRCRSCAGAGAGWQLLISNRLPRDCCRLHSRLATKDELKTYRLSTACAWFRCSVCARTQPFTNPTKEIS